MIIYCIVTALLNALASVILGISVLLKAPRRRENHLFAWFTASFAGWSLSYLLWQLAVREEDALIYARLLTGLSIFIPITYFHFVSRLTARQDPLEIRLGYLAAVAVASFTPTTLLVREVAPQMMFAHWPQPGPVFWPYIFTFAYYTARSWIILFQRLREATHWRRKQLTYVYFGTVVGWLGGSTNFLLWFDIPIPPIGNGLALVYIISVAYAMMRFRLVDIHVFVVKGLVYLLVIAVLAVAFPAVILLLLQHVPPGMNELRIVAVYVGAFLATLTLFLLAPRFSQKIDAILEEKALGALGGDRHKLREHIHHISTISGLGGIFQETVQVVSTALRVPRVEIYCRHDFEGDYGWRAGAAMDKAFFDRKSLLDDNWLVQTTRSSGKALVVYERDRTGAEADPIRECEKAGVELAIPIHADRLFYGLLLCGSRQGNRLYSDLDISLLEAVCIQIGLTVRARELERRSNQTEKLISLGTLAAGLAHELRNPLVSIRTFTELMREQGDDPDFRSQFGSVVERDVNRIGAIIDHVAAFANNAQITFSTVQIPQILRDVHEIAKAEFREGGVSFSMEDPALPPIRGNYSQLIQVFINLFQNSIHALAESPGPAPSIRVSFRMKKRRDGRRAVLVAVADNGPGIPAGIRARIFDPFVTTKDTGQNQPHRGMGLGLGIVKRIIEGHGGTIELASKTGTGTTFYVELPCEESSWESGAAAIGQPPAHGKDGHQLQLPVEPSAARHSSLWP